MNLLDLMTLLMEKLRLKIEINSLRVNHAGFTEINGTDAGDV